MKVTTFEKSPIFTLVNDASTESTLSNGNSCDGQSGAFNAHWVQLDAWASTHGLPLYWSVSDGTEMQAAVDADHQEALLMNGTWTLVSMLGYGDVIVVNPDTLETRTVVDMARNSHESVSQQAMVLNVYFSDDSMMTLRSSDVVYRIGAI